jgi:hypothetical protein
MESAASADRNAVQMPVMISNTAPWRFTANQPKMMVVFS